MTNNVTKKLNAKEYNMDCLETREKQKLEVARNLIDHLSLKGILAILISVSK